MNESKSYTFDGIELTVPLRRDAQTGIYIEDYREWIENPAFTPNGHPIMFAGEDACEAAEAAAPETADTDNAAAGTCPDCGSCRFYARAGEHTWIGVCLNERRRRE